ncbi:hypothetical protein F5Y08DRAFT_354587 [Xylaria arbuscula]|nr:hypothetical protein F5Y08DRAFT_354587 [Xylaria arbuscula]
MTMDKMAPSPVLKNKSEGQHPTHNSNGMPLRLKYDIFESSTSHANGSTHVDRKRSDEAVSRPSLDATRRYPSRAFFTRKQQRLYRAALVVGRGQLHRRSQLLHIKRSRGKGDALLAPTVEEKSLLSKDDMPNASTSHIDGEGQGKAPIENPPTQTRTDSLPPRDIHSHPANGLHADLEPGNSIDDVEERNAEERKRRIFEEFYIPRKARAIAPDHSESLLPEPDEADERPTRAEEFHGDNKNLLQVPSGPAPRPKPRPKASPSEWTRLFRYEPFLYCLFSAAEKAGIEIPSLEEYLHECIRYEVDYIQLVCHPRPASAREVHNGSESQGERSYLKDKALRYPESVGSSSVGEGHGDRSKSRGNKSRHGETTSHEDRKPTRPHNIKIVLTPPSDDGLEAVDITNEDEMGVDLNGHSDVSMAQNYTAPTASITTLTALETALRAVDIAQRTLNVALTELHTEEQTQNPPASKTTDRVKSQVNGGRKKADDFSREYLEKTWRRWHRVWEWCNT